MNDNNDYAQAMVKEKSSFSAIWILPIIAALIGIGMLYHHYQNRGIDITVEFENAEGLEARKTKVKYRNVDIGTLKTISFNKDGTSIEALVEIDRKSQQFLHSDSQFWVVRPRIGSAGISGFGTLLSGAYIAIEPGKSEYYAERFKGLENPPISSPNSAGLKLKLISEGGKSLQEGNPVIYRGFEVGAVEAVDFDVKSRKVSYNVFIKAPFDNLITTNTHFWNAGGFSVSADTEGLTVDFASMETILSGGVQFDVPDGLDLGERVNSPREFKLYSSKTGIIEERAYEYLEYVILVEDSVGGLDIGAPVEYRGILIGRVHRPYMSFHQKNQISPDENRIAVIVHIEPKRITQHDDYGLEWFDNQMMEWIKTGMGARLETANYLTGSLKVALDIDLDLAQGKQNEIEYFGKYKVIPTSQSGFASIMNKTEQLLIKLEQLPLAELANNTNKAIESANTTLLTANSKILATQSVLDAVESTLLEAKQTMTGLQPNSELYRKLEDNLNELERTLQMMQPFLQEIRRKPNSLIFSDLPPADTQPKGKSQ